MINGYLKRTDGNATAPRLCTLLRGSISNHHAAKPRDLTRGQITRGHTTSHKVTTDLHYRPTQPCIPPGVAKSSTNFGWGKGWNITSAGWQVTLCDPIWHVSSSSGVATSVSKLLYPCYFTFTLLHSSTVHENVDE